MKKKLLISLLTLPMIATSLTAVVSCGSKKTNDEVHAPFGSTTRYTVSFKANAEGITFIGNTSVQVESGTFFASVKCPSAYNKIGYPVDYWVDANGKKISPKFKITSELTVYPHFNDIEIQNCIGIMAISNTTVSIENHGENNPNIDYSTDGRTWNKYSNFITLSSGDCVYFKGDNKNGFSTSERDYTSFSIGGKVSLIGNVMTLIDNGKGEENKIPCPYCFYRLFESCSGIVSISSNLLPATHLMAYSYAYMFDDCTNLTAFPKALLPQKTLQQDETYTGAMCYAGMFSNCTGLTNIPVGFLPAGDTDKDPNANLGIYCYYAMFQNCTGLTQLDSGILPAKKLAQGCYTDMFAGCINLTKLATDLLPATELVDSCYFAMFSGCTGLDDLSEFDLPATNIASNAYNQMFYSCSNLTKAPIMHGTKLELDSYASMYCNCTSLEDVVPFPQDKEIELGIACCEYMFSRCTSLKSLPALPKNTETQLKPYCFTCMFQYCTGLTSLEKTALPYTNISAYCYDSMFLACENIETVMETLPATTLAPYCYVNMFNGTKITTAPKLPASKPESYCYASMFWGCKSLRNVNFQLDAFKWTDDQGTIHDAIGCLAGMFASCLNLVAHTETEGSRELLTTIPEEVEGVNISKYASDMFYNIQQSSTVVSTPVYGQSVYYVVQNK